MKIVMKVKRLRATEIFRKKKNRSNSYDQSKDASLVLRNEQRQVSKAMIVSVCSLLYCFWQTPNESFEVDLDRIGYLAVKIENKKQN